MERGRSFSTGVGSALASSACLGKKAVRQERMARGQRPVRSTAENIAASAWKQRSGWRSTCLLYTSPSPRD
eukprot:2818538-Alexandrium_andersonii.AAC.1